MSTNLSPNLSHHLTGSALSIIIQSVNSGPDWDCVWELEKLHFGRIFVWSWACGHMLRRLSLLKPLQETISCGQQSFMKVYFIRKDIEEGLKEADERLHCVLVDRRMGVHL